MTTNIVFKRLAKEVVEKSEKWLKEADRERKYREKNKKTWLSKHLRGKSTKVGGSSTLARKDSQKAVDVFIRHQKATAALQRVLTQTTQ